MSNQITVKDYFSKDQVKEKFNELLGDKSTTFVTSVLQVVNGNSALKRCEPASIFNAAAMAAVLGFPINSNFGDAYILPYGNKAQFQIGYKGFIQLAIRSGEYKTIGSTPIFEGQIVSNNPLTGYVFNFDIPKNGKTVGFAASFTLKNGFEKTIFMTTEEIIQHGKKYSKTFSSGPWKTDFDAMATKTIVKLLISKYGPKSLEMQQAVNSDQSIVQNFEENKFEYPDNEKTDEKVENINAQFEDAEVVDDNELM